MHQANESKTSPTPSRLTADWFLILSFFIYNVNTFGQFYCWWSKQYWMIKPFWNYLKWISWLRRKLTMILLCSILAHYRGVLIRMENLERITKLLKRDLQNLKSKNIKFRNSVKNDNLKLPELIGTYSRTENSTKVFIRRRVIISERILKIIIRQV